MFMTVRDELEIVHKTYECTQTLLQKFWFSDFKRTPLLRSARTYKIFITVRDELEIVHKTYECTRSLGRMFWSNDFKRTQLL